MTKETDNQQTTRPAVATIGTFDGVHRGHLLLLARVKEEAEHKGFQSLVITFDTTSQALAFERACRQAQAPGRLSPIPTQVSAGCGYAWRAGLGDRDAVLAAAHDAGCSYAAVHEVAL